MFEIFTTETKRNYFDKQLLFYIQQWWTNGFESETAELDY